MAEGAWQGTAWLLAMLHNVNRDPKTQRAMRPADFGLFAAKRRGKVKDLVVPHEGFAVLKAAMFRQTPPGKGKAT
jgi:hypothetical protein